MPAARQPLPAAHHTRLHQLAAAFDAYRRAQPRRRFPRGLQAQAVAMLATGVSASTLCAACRLSRTQLSRFQQLVAQAEVDPAAAPPLQPPARVLRVVDREPLTAAAACASDAELELRVGPWQLRLRRVSD